MWKNMFTISEDKGNKKLPLQSTGLVFLVFSVFYNSFLVGQIYLQI